MPAKRGPKPSLDDARQREVLAILTVGGNRQVAAHYVGCHPCTIYRTALRDPEFGRALSQAETRHEISHLNNINCAAKEAKYWRAAAWMLERKYPTRYGKRKPTALSAEQLATVLSQFADILVEELPDPEIRQRIMKRVGAITRQLEAVEQ